MDSKFHSVKPILDSSRLKVFIETYGCQMNTNDSEVVLSILQEDNYALTDKIEEADLVIINTCSIRENAEQRVWGRLDLFRTIKLKNRKLIVGVLGCMAERLKERLLEHSAVDIVAGPDSYRELPNLIRNFSDDNKQINTLLSIEETYADITPIRMDKNGVSAYISIMRGCNNMCTYCVVPYTRGGERSRDPESILSEVRQLFDNGYREVCLLGQNVDSYLWIDPENPTKKINFARLLEQVALIDKHLRVRFSTSHPKDMKNGVLYTMAMYSNICNHIHLPAQSGSDSILEKMNRKYSRDEYLERIAKIREILPECAITTDIIAGFCGESEEDHLATLSLMSEVKFDSAFMFQYSERPNTKAARHFQDSVPIEIKTKRLSEIIALQNRLSLESNKMDIGKEFEVLIEGVSKKSTEDMFGRNPQNKVCVFRAGEHAPGEYVTVKITACTSATLIGVIND